MQRFPCRRSSKRSTQRGGPMLTLLRACPARRQRSAAPVSALLSLDDISMHQSRFEALTRIFPKQVPAVHGGLLLHPLQRGACQGHPEGPGGDVQGSAAPHARPLPSIVPLPGAGNTVSFPVALQCLRASLRAFLALQHEVARQQRLQHLDTAATADLRNEGREGMQDGGCTCRCRAGCCQTQEVNTRGRAATSMTPSSSCC